MYIYGEVSGAPCQLQCAVASLAELEYTLFSRCARLFATDANAEYQTRHCTTGTGVQDAIFDPPILQPDKQQRPKE